MKRLFLGLFTFSLLSTDGTCLLKVGDMLDPTTVCGIDFERFDECLNIPENTTLSAEKKSGTFCRSIKQYAEITEVLKNANKPLLEINENMGKIENLLSNKKMINKDSLRKELKELESKKHQFESVRDDLTVKRKPFFDAIALHIPSEKISQIPTDLIVKKTRNITCPKDPKVKGRYYMGTKIREDVLDPKSPCGLNLNILQECIKQDRGEEGKGESFCNDVKLYAGNKSRPDLIKALPEAMREQTLKELNDSQRDYENRFINKYKLLTMAQLENIDPLGDMQQFTCSGKSDLKGSLESKKDSLKRKINVSFEDTIGLRDSKRTCGLDLSKIKVCKKSDNEKLRTFCGEVEGYASVKFYLDLYKTKAATAIGQEKRQYEDSIAKLEAHQHQGATTLENLGLTQAQIDNIPPFKEGSESTFQCKPIPSMRSSQSRSEFRSSMKRAFN